MAAPYARRKKKMGRPRRDGYLTVSHCAQSYGCLFQLCRSVHSDTADPLQEGVNVKEGGEGLTQKERKSESESNS